MKAYQTAFGLAVLLCTLAGCHPKDVDPQTPTAANPILQESGWETVGSIVAEGRYDNNNIGIVADDYSVIGDSLTVLFHEGMDSASRNQLYYLARMRPTTPWQTGLVKKPVPFPKYDYKHVYEVSRVAGLVPTTTKPYLSYFQFSPTEGTSALVSPQSQFDSRFSSTQIGMDPYHAVVPAADGSYTAGLSYPSPTNPTEQDGISYYFGYKTPSGSSLKIYKQDSALKITDVSGAIFNGRFYGITVDLFGSVSIVDPNLVTDSAALKPSVLARVMPAYQYGSTKYLITKTIGSSVLILVVGGGPMSGTIKGIWAYSWTPGSTEIQAVSVPDLTSAFQYPEGVGHYRSLRGFEFDEQGRTYRMEYAANFNGNYVLARYENGQRTELPGSAITKATLEKSYTVGLSAMKLIGDYMYTTIQSFNNSAPSRQMDIIRIKVR